MIKPRDLIKWNSVGHTDVFDSEPVGHVLNAGPKRSKIDQDNQTGAYRVIPVPDGVPGGTEDYFPDPL